MKEQKTDLSLNQIQFNNKKARELNKYKQEIAKYLVPMLQISTMGFSI